MANNNQLKPVVVNDLKIIIKYAKHCKKNCPVLHRLEALEKGLEILIRKERESDDKTTS